MNFSTRWHGKLLSYKEKKKKQNKKQIWIKIKRKKKIEKEDCC